jgi:hypothetical protein
MPKYIITARATILESYEMKAASEEHAIERWHSNEGEYLGRADAYLEPPEIEDVKPLVGGRGKPHTPALWHVVNRTGMPEIRAGAVSIADIRLNGHNMKHGEANARRIVAAVNACEGIGTEALEAGVLREIREALERLAFDASGDQNNPLIRDKTLESIERACVAVAKAKAECSPPDEAAAGLPIVTVAVRGGLIEDMDATIPVHVVVADWDVPDEETGRKPTQNVWQLAGGLSGPKAAKLRRLIAND